MSRIQGLAGSQYEPVKQYSNAGNFDLKGIKRELETQSHRIPSV